MNKDLSPLLNHFHRPFLTLHICFDFYVRCSLLTVATFKHAWLWPTKSIHFRYHWNEWHDYVTIYCIYKDMANAKQWHCVAKGNSFGWEKTGLVTLS